jgi:type VI secretion system protein ImpH
MGAQERPSTHTLALFRALEYAPRAFDFFQAVRRLECANPDKPRIGTSVRPADDPVRLGQRPSLAFPGVGDATIDAFEQRGDGSPPRLSVRFFGLSGPDGPLPLHLSERAYYRTRKPVDDPTLARFLDVFHHRMLSLFYRAWAACEASVQLDRPDQDRFADYFGALSGLGAPSLRNRDAMPDLAKLHYTGALALQTKSADGLRGMLEDFLGVPTAVEEFVGHWVELDESSCCRLGGSPATALLGRTALVGQRVWLCHDAIRIVLGPMDLDDYERLLPGGRGLARLAAAVRNYLGHELMFDVRLILEKEQVPPLRLGGSARLGWTTWLNHGRARRDASDLVLAPAGNHQHLTQGASHGRDPS